MEGYNFRFNIGSKNFVGVTSDNLNISAVTKDSITKDDQGARKKKVTGHDVTFRVSGIMGLNGTSGTDNDSDDIIEQALEIGDGAEVSFVYTRGSGQAYQGTAIMSNYTEDSPADDEATWSADFAVSGDMDKVTGGNG